MALVLVVGSVWLLTGADEGQPTLEAGEDAPVTTGPDDLGDTTSHNSPVMAQNPVDDANLVIASRIDGPEFSCALHRSADGGTTWTETAVPVPGGADRACHAPDLAFAADGTLHLIFLTLSGDAYRPSGLWLATSDDGGQSLSEPVRILDASPLQARLTTDPTRSERLHVTWLQADDIAGLGFADAGNPVKAMRSDDGGETWSEPVRVSDPGQARVVAPSPAIGPEGELYVTYLDLKDDGLDYHADHEGQGGPPYSGQWALTVARSTDGGRSWSRAAVDDPVQPVERVVVLRPPYPALAVDTTSDRVYVGLHDGRRGDSDVWVWASDDRAASWSDPVRVNDTPVGDGTTQSLPQLAVAPDGRLDVIYYDRRDDPDDVMTEVSLQASADGGATFTESVGLTTEAFDSRVGFGSNRGMAELGSRLALLSTERQALAAWTDTRSGTPLSGKQDLYRAVVTISGS